MRTASPPATGSDMSEPPLPPAPAPVDGSPPSRRTLLLVDDEENIISALRRVLRRDGYTILSATSGREGLSLLEQHPVDVIVSDQRMPGMTGVEFLRQVKRSHSETVRIVLSGYTELQSITDAINEGAIYKFLTKPWDDEQIRENIREAFQHKELADDNRRLAEALRQTNEELGLANQRLCALLAEKQRQLQLDEASLDIAREILHAVPAPIIGIGDDGLIVFANGCAERALGEEGLPLLGSFAEERLPAPLIELLQRDADGAAQIPLNGHLVRAIRRRMGDASRSRGRLLILLQEGLLHGDG